MGISGLLPFLKAASRPANVKDFVGTTIAVDVYCWLHKGAYGCAEQLARGQPTDAYVKYVMRYVDLLVRNNIKPILVFDGRNLPSKSETERKRRKMRKENRERAVELLREGRRDEARDFFARSVDITPAMARAVIEAARERNIDCIVAPYEADAQLAFLNMCGIANLVLTEDSDLTLFGCDKILFKLKDTVRRRRIGDIS
jgi:exonuclease-1